MGPNYNVSDVKYEIYDCIKTGASAVQVLSILYKDETFISKESTLWDFKYELNGDHSSLAKMIKLICSFYNTYGGYIIYGVHEIVKDKEFKPTTFDLDKIKPAQIESLLENYVDQTIEITFSQTKILYKGHEYSIGVIHVPQRDKKQISPAKFIKNSKKTIQSDSHEFKTGDVYFRKLDRCTKADDPEHWQFLFSERNLGKENSNEISISIEHNLPDKKMICADFFGRMETLSLLWEWLSDPFDYTKILAGDGGKGKTSIAYRFCQEFLESPPYGFERILWLSAKEKQFSGFETKFFGLRPVDFHNFISFLMALGENCAVNIEEIESTSIQNIKRKISDALNLFPSLIVVDNVDSLNQKEQIQLIETCRHLGKDKSRFLITTRNRFSFSDDTCIEISGLRRDDYDRFLQANVETYKIPAPKKKQIDNLYLSTDGSPLLTQSILRLCKLGDNLDTAISEWKGKSGEDARNAALFREIQGLTFDAKRVILCIYYFDNCSKSELQQACGLGKVKLDDVIIELNSLFLVNTPQFIENESRFSISTTTKLIVEGMQETLAADYNKLKLAIKKLRSGLSAPGKKGNTQRIGLAISQALALMRADRESEAITTITTELQRQPKNPDLLLAHARCILQSKNPDYDTARSILHSAHENGQVKEMLFDFWFNCESKLGSTVGEIEVCRKALQIKSKEGANKFLI
ncbi:ATP-binding protein [Enterobacter hormaechei]|nr:ATP-binding protein [Enterobacter hormaechei]GJL38714.1 ATP-binding protein [Enterobacter hormaechei]